MTTTPPAITNLPAAPDPGNRATFNSLAYPWSAALPTFGTQISAVAANVKANADEAQASADSAAEQVPLAATQATNAATSASLAQQAALSAGSVAWVSGTTYAVGDLRYSPLNLQAYRRRVAGGGSTDPSIDLTNWTLAVDTTAKIIRSARTSNTILGIADNGQLIDITSGTFTQTLPPAASLGDGWFCYIRNAGTGDITLDPNGAELIDGLTSYVMYPGECRLVQCDGASFNTILISGANYQEFLTSGTWTKPAGATFVYVEAIGGGASGVKLGGNCTGGGGGGFSAKLLKALDLTSTVSVAIGAGGASTTGGTHNAGGSSTFGSYALGKGAESYVAGGGELSPVNNQPACGGYSSGGGGRGAGAAGACVKGGAGGGGTGNSVGVIAGGVSQEGGNGGAGSETGNGVSGSVPGGGGGATLSGTSAGGGAAGRVRVWAW